MSSPRTNAAGAGIGRVREYRGKITRDSWLAASRAFSDGEWSMVNTVAEGLEWSYGWEATAAHRLRFLLDLAYATGLRASEVVQQ